VNQPERSIAEFLLYETEDGCTRVKCRFADDTLWLTQALMAELFQVKVPTINEHLKTLYAEGELLPEATFRDFLIVRHEDNRKASCNIDHSKLDAILAVSYRVRSVRGSHCSAAGPRSVCGSIRPAKGLTPTVTRLV
jgi:hypothetical protein